MDREKRIVRTSILGILANVFLAAFKAAIGTLTNSIAVTLDAVNNLSDALSSVITIIGTRLAGKEPDKKHPMGYGRIEYLSASIISVIVLYAGVSALVESIKKIVHPETPDYGPVALVIIGVAVVVKILLGRYVKHVGEQVHSDSLVASGEDATLDSVISASTLVAAAIYLIWGLSLEAWLGAVISLVIIKSGLELLRDTLSAILGERITPETAKAIKTTITNMPGVNGAYDLLLHSYGPERLVGSVHIEVPDSMTMLELDGLQRDLVTRVFQEHGVLLGGISVYARNTGDTEAETIRAQIETAAFAHPNVLQLHGFYLDRETKRVTFDLVVGYEEPDRMALCNAVKQEVETLLPGFTAHIQPDYDLSD